MWLRKKYSIDRNVKFMDQYVHKLHLVFEIMLGVMFVVYVTGSGFEGPELYTQLFIFLAVVFAIRTVLEYLFVRKSKKHIISITYTAICFICSIVFLVM